MEHLKFFKFFFVVFASIIFSCNSYALPITWQTMSYSSTSTIHDPYYVRDQQSSQSPPDSLPISSIAAYSFDQTFPITASGSGNATATAQNGLLTGSSSMSGQYLTSTNTTTFHGETFSDIYNIVNLYLPQWNYQLNGGVIGDINGFLQSAGIASTSFDIDISNMGTSENIFHYSQTRSGPSVHLFGYTGPVNGTETFNWNIAVPFQTNLAIDITLHDTAYHVSDLFSAYATTSTSLSYLIDGSFDSNLPSPEAPVPEPSTFFLLVFGVAGTALLRKKIF